jgi:hypothetical protein
MRRVFAVAIVTAIALLLLGGALAFFARKPPGKDEVAIRDIRPVWTEIKWPFARPVGGRQGIHLQSGRLRDGGEPVRAGENRLLQLHDWGGR